MGGIIAIPEKTSVISPQLGGWVNKLDVVEGQSVHAGEMLVEVTSRIELPEECGVAGDR